MYKPQSIRSIIYMKGDVCTKKNDIELIEILMKHSGKHHSEINSFDFERINITINITLLYNWVLGGF